MERNRFGQFVHSALLYHGHSWSPPVCPEAGSGCEAGEDVRVCSLGSVASRTHPRTRVPTLRLQTGPRCVHTQAEAAQCLASSHHLHPPSLTNQRPALSSRDLCGPIGGQCLNTICILPVVSGSADPWPAQTRPDCMAAARGWALENK